LLRNILTIYRKELKEVLRDRKTLIFMLVLPTLVVPILINAMIGFVAKAEKKARTETIPYAIVGEAHLPDLAREFGLENGFERVDLAPDDDLRSGIESGRIKLGVRIPDDAHDRLDNGRQVKVGLYFNNASVASKVKQRASGVIESYSEKRRAERLSQLGLADLQAQENVLSPVLIEEVGTADMREIVGERVGGLLPYFFIIFCFIGALYPAIDLGAGEKERGTLETLLLTPVPRQQLVLGKFAVIFTTGLVSTLLCLGSMTVWLFTKGQQVTDVLGSVIKSIQGTDLILIGSMLIPTAAMFASLLLVISIYAKSFKEAQSYATPLNFLAIIPAIFAMLPGVELTWNSAMIPITNVALAIKELIKGTMDYQMLYAIVGSSTVIAIALLVFCTKWFEREAVLFRE